MVLLKQAKALVLFELNAALGRAGGAGGAARRWTGTDTTSCATGAAGWLWRCVGATLIARSTARGRPLYVWLLAPPRPCFLEGCGHPDVVACCCVP